MNTTQRKTYVKFMVNGTLFGKPYVRVETLKGDTLGAINWYSSWRQFVFGPEPYCEFSFDCLEDIAAQVKAMNTGAQA